MYGCTRETEPQVLIIRNQKERKWNEKEKNQKKKEMELYMGKAEYTRWGISCVLTKLYILKR